MTRQCANNLNTICDTCLDSAIAVNLADGMQTCRQCAGGTYRSADKLSCVTCKSCTSEQYVKSGDECTLTKDRVCTDCQNNKATSILNSGSCDTCKPAYYSTSPGFCSLCTSAPCAPGFYQSCTNAVRACNLCAGLSASTACALRGYGPNQPTCPEGTATNTVCEPCPAGSERPNLAILQCSKCGLGFYKTAASASDCLACTNAPVSNSLYFTWGNAPATTASCEW